jgi:cytidine deaminase
MRHHLLFLVARALQQQHQVSEELNAVVKCQHAAAACGACQQFLQTFLQDYLPVP